MNGATCSDVDPDVCPCSICARRRQLLKEAADYAAMRAPSMADIVDAVHPADAPDICIGFVEDDAYKRGVERGREDLRPTVDDLRARMGEKHKRASRLSDEAGVLRTERDELLRENAVLRRRVEHLERTRGPR